MTTTQKPRKVLVIGSGPIVIGQAAEFDYAGTQACKALREEGIEVVLVNSNPATIMTDQETADHVYIEPLTVDVVERVIQRERPDGLLPTLGGQTGLNLAVELDNAGVLEKYDVEVLGTPISTIRTAEDRDLFWSLLQRLGEPTPPSKAVTTVEGALGVAEEIGYPVIVRPAYTLGGTGGGVAHGPKGLQTVAAGGIAASMVGQVLIERYLVGWKEIEYEVIRDAADNCVTVCNMENLDPMGVHTGDSIVVAPSQTLADKDYQRLRSAAINIIRGLKVEGGCNVQFAYRPGKEVSEHLSPVNESDPYYYVIEVNPRVSRSSALASKATGYPIARVAAKIAVGKTLDEIPNAITRKTSAAFEPALDYCVVKIPRWPFDKFPTGDRALGTQMKATGEVMAIDRTFEAALQKAVRGMEIGDKSLLWQDKSWEELTRSEWPEELLLPDDQRLWRVAAAIRRGMSPESVSIQTGIDPWFTRALGRIVEMERKLLSQDLSPSLMRRAKRLGFSDSQIATLADVLPERVRQQRIEWGIRPVYKMVDTCAGEFEATTPYFYSCYEEENEALPSAERSTVVLGSGPIRIGQGIEFDYSSVHAAWALQKAGITSVMVNSNPETVSTDFDTSDRLYFEPLDEESVRDIVENEAGSPESAERVALPSLAPVPAGGAGDGPSDIPGNPAGPLAAAGVHPGDGHTTMPECIVQFGGQTAINLSQGLGIAGLPILGSSAEAINIASDRGRFDDLVSRVGIPQPPAGVARTPEEALQIASNIGYPVLIRPSYVLGGRAMEILQNATEVVSYFKQVGRPGEGAEILVDRYLDGVEVEVDAACDGENVLIPGIMEHLERAGVHSGDSMALYPALALTEDEIDTVVDYTARIGRELGVTGLMNIQFVITGGGSYRDPSFERTRLGDGNSRVYILEVNPRSSRTVPFISKVTGIPLVQIAINAMRGQSVIDQGYEPGLAPRRPLVAVKAPVFSMSKLTGVDTFLGPEMKSTGEVMGIDVDYQRALVKALIAAKLTVPPRGAVLLSVADRDKADAISLVRALHRRGHPLYATEGTASMIEALGCPVTAVEKKLDEGHPNVVDVIQDDTVCAVVNTVTGERRPLHDGFYIRRAAAERQIPCFTSIDTARAAIESVHEGTYSVRRLDDYLNADERMSHLTA